MICHGLVLSMPRLIVGDTRSIEPDNELCTSANCGGTELPRGKDRNGGMCIKSHPSCFQPHVARDVISQPPPLKEEPQRRSRAEDNLSHAPYL